MITWPKWCVRVNESVNMPVLVRVCVCMSESVRVSVGVCMRVRARLCVCVCVWVFVCGMLRLFVSSEMKPDAA